MSDSPKQTKSVFVIMPFTESPTRDKEQLTSFFDDSLKKPIESADLLFSYKVRRSDDTFNITDKIIKDLFDADIVIADLSGKKKPNPNVMYELGVRLAISEKPVILIRESDPENEKIFDISHFFAFDYDPLVYSRVQEHVINKLRRFETGEEQYESPIRHILGLRLAASGPEFAKLPPDEQRTLVLASMRSLALKVARAFGPNGEGVYCTQPSGAALMMRGNDIAENVRSSNSVEALGIEFGRQITRHMDAVHGDGTSTALLLALGMIEAGDAAIRNGAVRHEVVQGLADASQEAVNIIESSSVSSSIETLRAVANSASRNRQVAEILEQLSKKNVRPSHIRFEFSQNDKDEVILREELQFVSCSSRPDGEQVTECRLDNVFVLVTTEAIGAIESIIPVMEICAKAGRPVLIAAPECNSEVLDMIRLNNEKGTISCIVLRPEGHKKGTEVLKDLAILTGARLISDYSERSLGDIKLGDLGVVRQVIVGSNRVRFCGVGGKSESIERRIAYLSAIEEEASSYLVREKIVDRLANLGVPVATIAVGGKSVQEKHLRTYSWVSARNSRASATEAGVSLGGGSALLWAAHKLSMPDNNSIGVREGRGAVKTALEIPIRTIVENAGQDVEAVIAEVLEDESSASGFDAVAKCITDLRQAEVLDSTAMLEVSIEIASSFAQTFLSTGTWDMPSSNN